MRQEIINAMSLVSDSATAEYEVWVQRFSIPTGAGSLMGGVLWSEVFMVLVQSSLILVDGAFSGLAARPYLLTVLIDQDKPPVNNLIYMPNFPRKMTLRGSGGIRDIDLQIFAVLKTGETVPLYVPNGQAWGATLEFTRRDVIY